MAARRLRPLRRKGFRSRPTSCMDRRSGRTFFGGGRWLARARCPAGACSRRNRRTFTRCCGSIRRAGRPPDGDRRDGEQRPAARCEREADLTCPRCLVQHNESRAGSIVSTDFSLAAPRRRSAEVAERAVRPVNAPWVEPVAHDIEPGSPAGHVLQCRCQERFPRSRRSLIGIALDSLGIDRARKIYQPLGVNKLMQVRNGNQPPEACRRKALRLDHGFESIGFSHKQSVDSIAYGAD